jgi:predicted DNA binding protein
LEILNTAYELGYFDFPRETDLKELSRRLNMSESTVSYHLRNIERKILSNILKDYNRGLVSKVSEE